MIYDRFDSRKPRTEQDLFLFAMGELGGWRKAWFAVRAVLDRRLQSRLAVVAALGARVGATVRGTPMRTTAPYLRTLARAKWALALGLATSSGAFLAYRLAATADACEPARVQTMAATPPSGTETQTVTTENCLQNSEVVSE